MRGVAKKKEQPPALLESLYQERMAILTTIEDKQLEPMNELLVQELGHIIRDRTHQGEFAPMVCDHCYSDLWLSKGSKQLSCPGCGWSV